MSRPVVGIQFLEDASGKRGSTAPNKATWVAAFEPLDKSAAERVQKEKNWRHKYTKYVVEHVKLSLKSPQSALDAAKAGLASAHSHFEFIREGKSYKFVDAMRDIKGSFSTGIVRGKLAKDPKLCLEVPYKNKNISKDELIAQINKWVEYGTIEKDCGDAMIKVAKTPGWVDMSDLYFVMLGAGSAMGPFLKLMEWGANVIAVDLDRSFIWERLITTARQSRGTLTFPLKKPQDELADDKELYENAGGNLMTHTPEIKNWLLSVYPEKDLTIGNYVYLNGEMFFRVTVACDAIIKALAEERKNTSIAFLCTPTDCHVITDEARKASAANRYLTVSLLSPLFGMFGMLQSNTEKQVVAKDGEKFSFVNGLVVPQGPNYCLSKRIQHWRAIVSRESGCTVSSNVAPSTATKSVVQRKSFAWVYDGITFFKPYEIFEQDTSNAVMSALLLHDLRNKKSPANADVPLRNPLELFKFHSFHGGVWRCGYNFESLGAAAVLIHFAKVAGPFLLLAVLVATVAFVWSTQLM